MKKYMKFVSAALFLVSLGCIFMDMIKIAVWKINGADILKMGFGEVDRDNMLHMVLTYAQDYMEKMILLILAIIILSIAGMVLSIILEGNIGYLAGVIFAAIDTLLVFVIYSGLNRNISDIRDAMDFFGTDGVAKMYHFTFILWILIYVVIIALSILGLLAKGNEKAPVKGQIYAEQFNSRKNSLKQNRAVNMQNADVQRNVRRQQNVKRAPEYGANQNARMPQAPRVQPEVRMPQAPRVQPEVRMSQISGIQPEIKAHTTDIVSKQVQSEVCASGFGGAIVGKEGVYAGKAYLLEDKHEVFFVKRQLAMEVSEYEETDALAGVYYISAYKEYCVDVRQSRTVYLESGQPLGSGREYYLPRGTRIYLDEKANLFELA